MTFSRRLVYPLCLLAGSLLAVVAGALHPDIVALDGAGQLAVIARSPAWPAIHWAFLFSFPLALTGLFAVIRMHAGPPGGSAVRPAILATPPAYPWRASTSASMVGPGRPLGRGFPT